LERPLLVSEGNRPHEILRLLREAIPIRDEDFAASRVAKETRDSFRVLVVTILSQNCTDVAALRAYNRLDNRVGVTITQLRKARVRTIENAIRVAGLHKQKARALRKLSRIIAEEYSGSFASMLKSSFGEMRDRLQRLPNVGPKTADVLLSILGQPTISVDTHVDRVSKRLGLAPKKGRYEEVRSYLMQAFRGEDYSVVPMYFMALGRKVCKARHPLCPKCPINNLCPYDKKTKTIRTSAAVK
jgi:endonuclease-3